MAQADSNKLPTSETRVLRMLSQGAPLAGVLPELCDFIDAQSPGVISTVLLLDQDGVSLRLAAGPKVPQSWNKALEGLTLPPRTAFQARAEGQYEFAPSANPESDPSFGVWWGLALTEGVRGAWAAPILSKSGKILGTLILVYPAPHSPGERDLELMEQAVHIAAIAIECDQHEEERKRSYQRLYQSQDDERRRIARELHDSTGQTVSLLAMNLSMATSRVTTRPHEVENILAECTVLTKNVQDELRTLSYLLHPPLLDECGLSSAIEWYASGINQRDGLHVDVEISPDLPRLSEDAEITVFRVVQASLTNVHLHSQAVSARVIIERTRAGIVLTISDNGTGIPEGVLDHSSGTKTIGVGIAGMRERVEHLGGLIEIETSSLGTKIRATIPAPHFRTAANS